MMLLLALWYADMSGQLRFGNYAALVDKWHFGVGRIVDFAALGMLAIRFRPALRPLAIRPLVMLGQASLPVFCVHLLCVLSALTLLGNRPTLGGWQAVAALLASLAAMIFTAGVAARRRLRRSEAAARVVPADIPRPSPASPRRGVPLGCVQRRHEF